MSSTNQPASAERGALKIFGVLFIVLGVVYLIGGGVFIFGARLLDPAETMTVVEGLDLSTMVLSLAMGLWWLVCGVFYIVFGALGIRGAKNPAKIGVFMVLAWIVAVLGLIAVILSQLINGGLGVNLFGWIVFAVTIASAIYATKIHGEVKRG